MLYTVIEYRVMTLGEAINRRIHRHAMPGGDDRLKLRGSDLVFLRIITLKSVSKLKVSYQFVDHRITACYNGINIRYH